jgi:hypothetical protein
MSATGNPPFVTDEPPPLKGPPPVIQSYQPDVPNFMRLGSVPVNYLQQVETDLLEPQVFQEGSGNSVDGFARFTLQNKGFLSSHSKIFMSLTPPSTVSRAMYSPSVGVGKVIKRAVLKVGNKVLNEISEWDKLHAFHSTKISNENNVERELYTTGRYMNMDFNYEDGASLGQVVQGTSLNVGLDPTTNYDDSYVEEMMPFALMDGNNPAESPSYAIDLSDLFPFLKVHSLPLVAMMEDVVVELTFHPPVNNRAVLITGTGSQAFNIDRNELKFCADYIFYGASDEMQRWMDQNKQLDFSFVDYRAITTTVSNTSVQSDTVRNIGMASRLVNKVITFFNRSDLGEGNLMMNTGALSPHISADGVVGDFEINIKYNDKFEFSTNVDNKARLYSLLQSAESMVFISRDCYSSEGRSLTAQVGTTHHFESKAQTQLAGRFFYSSIRLSSGRVGQRGLEIHFKAPSGMRDSNVDVLRNYCEYLRSARLENGMISVFNL